MKHLHKFVLGAVMLGLATFALGMMFFLHDDPVRRQYLMASSPW